MTENIDIPVNVIPLGGLGEIGKNMWLYCYGDDMIVVDCGLMFPTEEMYGVDMVLPDMSYVIENQKNLKGIIVTHGHEDHIGGFFYFLKQLDVIPPILGAKLTLGLLEDRLDQNLKKRVILHEVKPRDRVQLGNFLIEFLKVCHSIPDTLGLAIQTPVGTIIHTADFKIDPTPIDGNPTDLFKFAEYGEKGVLLLIADSTNAERVGYTPSEREVGMAFDDIFAKAHNRVIVATFATNIHRIQQVINAAVNSGRKIAVIGRSIEHVVHRAIALGYIVCPEDAMIRPSDLCWHEDSKIAIITTGSQGEPMSVLSRMANREHKYINVVPGDIVVISAQPIPGNEKLVFRTINKLFACGAEVVYESNAGMHVSGHASREELKMMLNLTKPRFFIPMHGEHRHLIHHADLAASINVKPENIIIMDNGDILELRSDSASIVGQVSTGILMIDGAGIGHVGDKILKDRRDLSRDGVLFITLVTDKTGKLVAEPRVVSKGFILVGAEENIYKEAAVMIKTLLDEEWNKTNFLDIPELDRLATQLVREFFYRLTRRKPIVMPVIQQLD